MIREEIGRLKQKGYQRIRIDGVIKRIDDPELIPNELGKEFVTEIVVDRLKIAPDQKGRLADSLELAFEEGKNTALALIEQADRSFAEIVLSQDLVCQKTGKTFEKLTPKHFSPNHLQGACPACQGTGQKLQFQAELIVPDPLLRSKTERSSLASRLQANDHQTQRHSQTIGGAIPFRPQNSLAGSRSANPKGYSIRHRRPPL